MSRRLLRHTRSRGEAVGTSGQFGRTPRIVCAATTVPQRGDTATLFKWSPFPRRKGPGEETKIIAEGRERMAAVRAAVGPGIDILVECAEQFTPRVARLAGRAIEEFNPFWIEEPISRENPRALAELKQGFPLPIASGENLLSRWEFRELLELQACDIIQPDLVHAGGITEVRKIASLADMYYIPLAPHNSGGPIATLMSIHLMASIPNFLILEQIEYERELRAKVSTNPLVFENGCFLLPTEPGLGTDINLDALADYPYKPQAASGQVIPPYYA